MWHILVVSVYSSRVRGEKARGKISVLIGKENKNIFIIRNKPFSLDHNAKI